VRIPHKAVAVFRVRTEPVCHWETGKALRFGLSAPRSVRILVRPSAASGGVIRLCGSPESWMQGFPRQGGTVSMSCPPSASRSQTVFCLSAPRKTACSLSRRSPPPRAAAFICPKRPRQRSSSAGGVFAFFTYCPGSPGRRRPDPPARPASKCRTWGRRARSSACAPCAGTAAESSTARCCPRSSGGWEDR